jgi:hypothetical protein
MSSEIFDIPCKFCGNKGVRYKARKMCSRCYYQESKLKKAFNLGFPDGFILEDYLKQKPRFITKTDYVKTEVYEYLKRVNGQINR